jgi:hypothetical protein
MINVFFHFYINCDYDDAEDDNIIILSKMAFDEALHDICSRFLNQNFDESDKNMCEKCFKMKDHLEVFINELKSAQLKIKILQEEVKSTSTGPGKHDNLTNCVE